MPPPPASSLTQDTPEKGQESLAFVSLARVRTDSMGAPPAQRAAPSGPGEPSKTALVGETVPAVEQLLCS